MTTSQRLFCINSSSGQNYKLLVSCIAETFLRSESGEVGVCGGWVVFFSPLLATGNFFSASAQLFEFPHPHPVETDLDLRPRAIWFAKHKLKWLAKCTTKKNRTQYVIEAHAACVSLHEMHRFTTWESANLLPPLQNIRLAVWKRAGA